jgi:hypothetical protein
MLLPHAGRIVASPEEDWSLSFTLHDEEIAPAEGYGSALTAEA